jgi:hypothetical protein
VPQESSIMNTLSDITNIENDSEVIFVHALNSLLFGFSHFRKKLDILISIASFFRKLENVLCVTFLVPSGTLSLVKYPVLIKPNIQCIFLTVAIGNCMVKLIPPVNFCSDENIQTIFGTKLEDFLNYRIDYNSIS